MGTSPLLWTNNDVYLWENQSLKVKPEQSIDALCINTTYALNKIYDYYTNSSGTGKKKIPRE